MRDSLAVATHVVEIIAPHLPYMEPFRTALQKEIQNPEVSQDREAAEMLWARIYTKFNGDRDLLVLNPFRDVKIVTPEEFLRIGLGEAGGLEAIDSG